MVRAFIGVGSNINPEENVWAALHRLAKQTHLVAVSMVYRTVALGRPEQPQYYNCVAEIATSEQPLAVKRGMLQPIEQALGRIRSADKFAPRPIDLDLIVYGDLVLHTDGMTIPDPEIMERPFLAIPLAELAPTLVLPGCDCPIYEIAAAMEAREMVPLEKYAHLLREEIARA